MSTSAYYTTSGSGGDGGGGLSGTRSYTLSNSDATYPTERATITTATTPHASSASYGAYSSTATKTVYGGSTTSVHGSSVAPVSASASPASSTTHYSTSYYAPSSVSASHSTTHSPAGATPAFVTYSSYNGGSTTTTTQPTTATAVGNNGDTYNYHNTSVGSTSSTVTYRGSTGATALTPNANASDANSHTLSSYLQSASTDGRSNALEVNLPGVLCRCRGEEQHYLDAATPRTQEAVLRQRPATVHKRGCPFISGAAAPAQTTSVSTTAHTRASQQDEPTWGDYQSTTNTTSRSSGLTTNRYSFGSNYNTYRSSMGGDLATGRTSCQSTKTTARTTARSKSPSATNTGRLSHVPKATSSVGSTSTNSTRQTQRTPLRSGFSGAAGHVRNGKEYSVHQRLYELAIPSDYAVKGQNNASSKRATPLRTATSPTSAGTRSFANASFATSASYHSRAGGARKKTPTIASKMTTTKSSSASMSGAPQSLQTSAYPSQTRRRSSATPSHGSLSYSLRRSVDSDLTSQPDRGTQPHPSSLGASSGLNFDGFGDGERGHNDNRGGVRSNETYHDDGDEEEEDGSDDNSSAEAGGGGSALDKKNYERMTQELWAMKQKHELEIEEMRIKWLGGGRQQRGSNKTVTQRQKQREMLQRQKEQLQLQQEQRERRMRQQQQQQQNKTSSSANVFTTNSSRRKTPKVVRKETPSKTGGKQQTIKKKPQQQPMSMSNQTVNNYNIENATITNVNHPMDQQQQQSTRTTEVRLGPSTTASVGGGSGGSSTSSYVPHNAAVLKTNDESNDKTTTYTYISPTVRRNTGVRGAEVGMGDTGSSSTPNYFTSNTRNRTPLAGGRGRTEERHSANTSMSATSNKARSGHSRTNSRSTTSRANSRNGSRANSVTGNYTTVTSRNNNSKNAQYSSTTSNTATSGATVFERLYSGGTGVGSGVSGGRQTSTTTATQQTTSSSSAPAPLSSASLAGEVQQKYYYSSSGTGTAVSPTQHSAYQSSASVLAQQYTSVAAAEDGGHLQPSARVSQQSGAEDDGEVFIDMNPYRGMAVSDVNNHVKYYTFDTNDTAAATSDKTNIKPTSNIGNSRKSSLGGGEGGGKPASRTISPTISALKPQTYPKAFALNDDGADNSSSDNKNASRNTTFGWTSSSATTNPSATSTAGNDYRTSHGATATSGYSQQDAVQSRGENNNSTQQVQYFSHERRTSFTSSSKEAVSAATSYATRAADSKATTDQLASTAPSTTNDNSSTVTTQPSQYLGSTSSVGAAASTAVAATTASAATLAAAAAAAGYTTYGGLCSARSIGATSFAGGSTCYTTTTNGTRINLRKLKIHASKKVPTPSCVPELAVHLAVAQKQAEKEKQTEQTQQSVIPPPALTTTNSADPVASAMAAAEAAIKAAEESNKPQTQTETLVSDMFSTTDAPYEDVEEARECIAETVSVMPTEVEIKVFIKPNTTRASLGNVIPSEEENKKRDDVIGKEGEDERWETGYVEWVFIGPNAAVAASRLISMNDEELERERLIMEVEF